MKQPLFPLSLLLLASLCQLNTGAWATPDQVSVSCTSPQATIAGGGGIVDALVNCVINAPEATGAYRIVGSANNMMLPSSLILNSGLNLLNGTLQPTVTSPDNTVTSISGTSSGFTANISSTSSTLRFEYAITTTSSTPAGLYQSIVAPAFYEYHICTTLSCSQQSFLGTASSILSVNVMSTPVSVSCTSSPVNAPPGGGSFTLDVLCMITGGNPGKFSSSSQNIFSPSVVSLSNGASSLSATLQSGVTSPDSSVTGITGTANGGFTGTINTVPAKIQIQYSGNTTQSTPGGTYSSAPVLFTWSTL